MQRDKEAVAEMMRKKQAAGKKRSCVEHAPDCLETDRIRALADAKKQAAATTK